MHVQVVTYRMLGIGEAEFIEANGEFAEMMEQTPGLLAKVWLKGGDENLYGGVYLWEDQKACESFLAGELWEEVVKDDSVLELASNDFAVNEELTKRTQPALKVL